MNFRASLFIVGFLLLSGCVQSLPREAGRDPLSLPVEDRMPPAKPLLGAESNISSRVAVSPSGAAASEGFPVTVVAYCMPPLDSALGKKIMPVLRNENVQEDTQTVSRNTAAELFKEARAGRLSPAKETLRYRFLILDEDKTLAEKNFSGEFSPAVARGGYKGMHFGRERIAELVIRPSAIATLEVGGAGVFYPRPDRNWKGDGKCRLITREGEMYGLYSRWLKAEVAGMRFIVLVGCK